MAFERTISDEQVEQVRDLYQAGWGEYKIAESLDMNHWTVRDILRAKGRFAAFGPRLMHGKRPASQLAIYRNGTVNTLEDQT